MISLNYGFLEKLIAESKMDQKELALEIGLPEKFFSRLRKDGSNLNVGEFCMLADYFDIGVEELLNEGDDIWLREKIAKGKKLFAKYYDYQRRAEAIPPDIAAYKSTWVSDVKLGKVYTCSPEQYYVEQKDEYNRNNAVFETMDNVLTSAVCSAICRFQDRDIIREKILEYLVYGVRPKMSGVSSRRIISLADKACWMLVNELEYKRLG